MLTFLVLLKWSRVGVLVDVLGCSYFFVFSTVELLENLPSSFVLLFMFYVDDDKEQRNSNLQRCTGINLFRGETKNLEK